MSQTTMSQKTHCAVAFEDIYQRSVWGQNGDGSGGGSDPEFAQGVSDVLLTLNNRFNIMSMLDAPCGACKWTSSFLKKVRPGFQYTGIDVSETAVQRAKLNLQNVCDASIHLHDLTVCPFPGSFDMILCRDALQHLSYVDVFKVLRNFKEMALQGNGKLFAIGSYLMPGGNVDSETPASYLINLLDPPFKLQPDFIIAEMHHETHIQPVPKHLFIYKANTVSAWSLPAAGQ